jgi:hypothetical protein
VQLLLDVLLEGDGRESAERGTEKKKEKGRMGAI